ncbi:LytR/AlgR family response regulator transcription factor [Chitinophaga vietnamensis]|uniref:LytR/AlgR family response regulator transcription factor n=1 Tax=Chitinophaga vietnamensis TaxID=2593957 RepID=UPI0011774C43|nr:LytTR family DNA-binding domain-containing protein [Chitinophaga vietnamensis]
MIRCLIIDDEKSAIDVLAHHISKTENLQLAGSTLSALEGLSLIQQGEFDLVFLDIQMPEMTGLEIARIVHDKCKIIFTTAYTEYAIKGFEFGVVDFLAKPIPLSRFLMAVEKVMTPFNREKPKEEEYMFVQAGAKGRIFKVNFSDIYYIEAMKNCVAIFHRDEKLIVRGTFKDIESKLPPGLLLRAHRSFFVAASKIITIEQSAVHFGGNIRPVPIGEHYKTAFYAAISKKVM